MQKYQARYNRWKRKSERWQMAGAKTPARGAGEWSRKAGGWTAPPVTPPSGGAFKEYRNLKRETIDGRKARALADSGCEDASAWGGRMVPEGRRMGCPSPVTPPSDSAFKEYKNLKRETVDGRKVRALADGWRDHPPSPRCNVELVAPLASHQRSDLFLPFADPPTWRTINIEMGHGCTRDARAL